MEGAAIGQSTELDGCTAGKHASQGVGDQGDL